MFHSLKDSERRYRTPFNAAGGTPSLTLKAGLIIDCNPLRAGAVRLLARTTCWARCVVICRPPSSRPGNSPRRAWWTIIKEIEDGTPTLL